MKRNRILIGIVAFALIGTAIIGLSRASSGSFVLEGEDFEGQISRVESTDASNNTYIQFGPVTVSACTVSVSSVRATDNSVEITVNTSAADVKGIIIAFGDGSTSSFDSNGPATIRHRYPVDSTSRSYEIQARQVDGSPKSEVLCTKQISIAANPLLGSMTMVKEDGMLDKIQAATSANQVESLMSAWMTEQASLGGESTQRKFWVTQTGPLMEPSLLVDHAKPEIFRQVQATASMFVLASTRFPAKIFAATNATNVGVTNNNTVAWVAQQPDIKDAKGRPLTQLNLKLAESLNTIIHELAHTLDFALNTTQEKNEAFYSKNFALTTAQNPDFYYGQPVDQLRRVPCSYQGVDSIYDAVPSGYGSSGPAEDIAEMFMNVWQSPAQSPIAEGRNPLKNNWYKMIECSATLKSKHLHLVEWMKQIDSMITPELIALLGTAPGITTGIENEFKIISAYPTEHERIAHNLGKDVPVVRLGNTFIITEDGQVDVTDQIFTVGDKDARFFYGDWNGDGSQTIGYFVNGTFTLYNTATATDSPRIIAYGGNTTDGVVGDWNGDGTDTIGVYNKADAKFSLRNSNSAGPADYSFSIGKRYEGSTTGSIDYTYISTGDWNGNGRDGIAMLVGDNYLVANDVTASVVTAHQPAIGLSHMQGGLNIKAGDDRDFSGYSPTLSYSSAFSESRLFPAHAIGTPADSGARPGTEYAWVLFRSEFKNQHIMWVKK